MDIYLYCFSSTSVGCSPLTIGPHLSIWFTSLSSEVGTHISFTVLITALKNALRFFVGGSGTSDTVLSSVHVLIFSIRDDFQVTFSSSLHHYSLNLGSRDGAMGSTLISSYLGNLRSTACLTAFHQKAIKLLQTCNVGISVLNPHIHWIPMLPVPTFSP